MFSEYSTDGSREKWIGIFCKSYLPIGKKRLIFAVLLKVRGAKVGKQLLVTKTKLGNGLVVQLVRMPPCHGGGRGFESRPVRRELTKTLVDIESARVFYLGVVGFVVGNINSNECFYNFKLLSPVLITESA